MYYTLFLPALAVLVVAGYRLFHLRRHDRVLDRFWKVRQHAIQVLQENKESIQPETYRDVRELIEFLDDKIEHHEARKQDLFNLRKADLTKDDVEEALEFVSAGEDQADELHTLYHETVLAMGAAFYAYTPFTILLLVALGVLLLAALGMHMARKLMRTVYRYTETILRNGSHRGRFQPTLGTGV